MMAVHYPSSPTALRRQREAAQRRKSILDAARQVFWRQGYEKATMPAIAAQAELATGTLYLYFPSKLALYVELLAEGYELLQQHLATALKTSDLPRRQAEAMIDAFFDFARQNPEYFEIMFFIAQREASNRENGPSPEQAARLRSAEARCKALAAQVLNSAGSATLWGLQESVEAIWAMLAGVILYFRADPRFQSIAKEASRLVLAAVFQGS